jgi:hypothetical protein
MIELYEVLFPISWAQVLSRGSNFKVHLLVQKVGFIILIPTSPTSLNLDQWDAIFFHLINCMKI